MNPKRKVLAQRKWLRRASLCLLVCVLMSAAAVAVSLKYKSERVEALNQEFTDILAANSSTELGELEVLRAKLVSLIVDELGGTVDEEEEPADEPAEVPETDDFQTGSGGAIENGDNGDGKGGGDGEGEGDTGCGSDAAVCEKEAKIQCSDDSLGFGYGNNIWVPCNSDCSGWDTSICVGALEEAQKANTEMKVKIEVLGKPKIKIIKIEVISVSVDAVSGKFSATCSGDGHLYSQLGDDYEKAGEKACNLVINKLNKIYGDAVVP